MKKLLALLFASVLVLAACGDKDDSSKDSSSNNSSNKSSESKKDSGDTDSVKVDSSSDDKKKSDSSFKDDKLSSKNFDVEILDTQIVDASKYADDDKPNIAIVYGVKKKTDKEDVTASSAFDMSFEAYQDSKDVKRELKTGDAYDSELDRKYGENGTDEINKGGKVKAVKFYKLKDTKTPVTLQVKDPDDYSNDNLAKKEIKLK
ncbi:DUF5067 domain-containing protein [Staphylococcus pasteuri]|uniref:DUF5067 domain-containing protein n=2 Tax=Staphylococcus TaxID=1279 RepID=A0ABY1H261_9STAP|nr:MULTISPECIES: DUF5067 domain-containing protein [Staphylococcus]ODB48078.1 DUF5067 domain-containing protein [Staphylococcus sp. AOAB]RQX28335.1 DUF5067 domain-containing protein [Staphylococcus warneri]ATH61623.1 DUF5067 domain-containing protein [Staphylococcus pasteuri]MCF7599774.1 DUF5067 domain-containing protein [Staphylococcus pasteuri]MCO0862503.1 DUF5067 domain-containing protein [Staphylococcus pasteuri]